MIVKRTWYVLSSILVLAFLVASAFMAMRMLNARALNNASGGDKSINVEYVPAPKLPRQAADMSGLVISVKDNSVFVAQVGLDHISVRRLLQQPTPAGPYSEVVVSKNTKIYRDATYVSVPSSGGSSGGAVQQVQQKLELIDTSAITAPSYVQVWGQRRGDRINADIIVVLGPIIANSAGGQ